MSSSDNLTLWGVLVLDPFDGSDMEFTGSLIGGADDELSVRRIIAETPVNNPYSPKKKDLRLMLNGVKGDGTIINRMFVVQY